MAQIETVCGRIAAGVCAFIIRPASCRYILIRYNGFGHSAIRQLSACCSLNKHYINPSIILLQKLRL